eukprot:5773720-Pleurochrysis_carterae.AAC.2
MSSECTLLKLSLEHLTCGEGGAGGRLIRGGGVVVDGSFAPQRGWCRLSVADLTQLSTVSHAGESEQAPRGVCTVVAGPMRSESTAGRPAYSSSLERTA